MRPRPTLKPAKSLCEQSPRRGAGHPASASAACPEEGVRRDWIRVTMDADGAFTVHNQPQHGPVRRERDIAEGRRAPLWETRKPIEPPKGLYAPEVSQAAPPKTTTPVPMPFELRPSPTPAPAPAPVRVSEVAWSSTPSQEAFEAFDWESVDLDAMAWKLREAPGPLLPSMASTSGCRARSRRWSISSAAGGRCGFDSRRLHHHVALLRNHSGKVE